MIEILEAEQSPLLQALKEVCSRMGRDSRNMMVGGSFGLMLRGVPIGSGPRDLDLYCDLEHVEPLSRKLLYYVVEPPADSTTDRYYSRLSRYDVLGVPVELVGGFRVFSHECDYRVDVQRWIAAFSETIDVGDVRLSLMPLAHEFLFNLLRDRPDRYEPIADVLRSDPVSFVVLERLIEANRWSPTILSVIRSMFPLTP